MRSAVALAVANVAAGVLNYLFQVHAAAVLDAAAFGLLSAWLAQVTIAAAAATVIQFVSLERAVSDAAFTLFARVAGGVSLLTLVAYALLGYHAPRAFLTAGAVLGPFLLCILIGQLQARLRLGVIAASVFAMYALRFGLPFAWKSDARAPAFYVAHAATAFAGVAAAAVLLPLSSRQPEPAAPVPASASAARGGWLLRFGRPVLLGFATLLFPLVDVLVVSTAHDPATTGAFSRMALAARIVFFGGAAVLPVLLPHQLHVAKTGTELPRFVVLAERWLAPALLVSAVVLAVGVDRIVLHPGAEERVWLYASCIAAALLVAILAHVQRFAAQGRLVAAGLCVVGVVMARLAGAVLAHQAFHASVTAYVVAVVVGDALVLLGARSRQLPFTRALR